MLHNKTNLSLFDKVYFYPHNLRLMKRIIAMSMIIGLSIGYAFTKGPGHATDWHAFRLWILGLPHEVGVWNPYWTKLILAPIAWLPQDIGHALINGLTFTAVSLSGNHLWPLLTFALNDHAWVGNLDGFIILGIILARCQNPYLVGMGLFFQSIKPQYLPLSLYYMWRCRNYRLFVIPLAAFGLSLLVYGNWIPEWLAILPPTPPQSINVSFYPWSIPVWFLLPFAADKERFILSATIVATPYFNQVSIITLFAFQWSIWAIVILIALSWLSPILVGPFALIYAFLRGANATPSSKILCDFLTNPNNIWNRLVTSNSQSPANYSTTQ